MMDSLVRLGQIGGFQIYAQPFGLIILGLLSLSFGGSLGLAGGLLFFAVILAAILLHELGHAYIARRRGMWVGQIVLQAFGGVTTWQGRATWKDRFWITVAGPAVNLVIAAISFALLRVLPITSFSFAATLLGVLYVVNLFLGVFNLLPIVPLDGGMILQTVLTGKLGARYAPLAYPVGIVGSGLLVLYGIWQGWLFAALFGGLFLYMNWQRWKAEGPRGGIGAFWEEFKANRERNWLRRHRQEVDKALRRSLEEGIHSLSPRERELLKKARKHNEWRN